VRRLLIALTFFTTLGAKAELVPIDPRLLSSPPYSYLKESVKRLDASDVHERRYITFLGSWENNGEANWERSSWWGRFYIDCNDRTFKVQHFRHRHVGSGWSAAERNYTALFALENFCSKIDQLPGESKSIKTLNEEFTKEQHDITSPFRAIY